jgi:thiamine pyrophosphokinase
VLVVAAGDVPDRGVLDAAWPGWDEDVAEVVAADAGLRHARRLGLAPQLLVGDLDSLGASSASDAAHRGPEVLRSPVDKDESDTELAMLEAVRRGATRITVLGALGGARLDHALANVWLLAHPAIATVDVMLLDAGARVRLVHGPAEQPLPGRVGATVTLLPFGGDADGITTRGLRYPLAGERLRTGPARGLSNVREAADAAVTLSTGALLVVESPREVEALDSGA